LLDGAKIRSATNRWYKGGGCEGSWQGPDVNAD